MQRIIIAFYLYLITSLFIKGAAQTTNGVQSASQNTYEDLHVKERSRKSHKQSERITKKNNKARNGANKKAEKDRKEKLTGKKNKEDDHQFPH